MKKTNYLIPQTEAVELLAEMPVLLLGSPTGPEPVNSGSGAPGRYAPGGGDLGGVPAR